MAKECSHDYRPVSPTAKERDSAWEYRDCTHCGHRILVSVWAEEARKRLSD